MRLPINQPYTITTPFGVPDSYALFGRHSGIDYAVPLNRAIYAPASGTLTNVVSSTGGNMVVIYDGKYWHRLMHNNSFSRSNGAVKEGEQVAKAGTTGLSTGVHCHWDVNTEGTYPAKFSSFVDPNSILKQEEDMPTPGEINTIIYWMTAAAGAKRKATASEINKFSKLPWSEFVAYYEKIAPNYVKAGIISRTVDKTKELKDKIINFVKGA